MPPPTHCARAALTGQAIVRQVQLDDTSLCVNRDATPVFQILGSNPAFIVTPIVATGLDVQMNKRRLIFFHRTCIESKSDRQGCDIKTIVDLEKR